MEQVDAKVDVLAVLDGDGFAYPEKPAPRAWGYLDASGVEWAAYDAGQMEAYSRVSYSDGFRAGFADGFQSGCDAVMTPIYRAGTVTDAMVDEAMDAYNKSYKGGQREWIRDALVAALARVGGAA